MTELLNRRLILEARPHGRPTHRDVVMHTEAMPQPAPGQVVIHNLYLSLDPAIRDWMSDVPSYLPPIELGQPVRSTSVGRVVISAHPNFKPGDAVVGLNAWEDYSLAQGDALMKIDAASPYPLHYYLSIFGAVGLTPYFGLLDVGQPKPGETVLVSAAAGAVGSLVGQIAKIKGCRAVGIAGSDEKCRWIVEELGFDAAINYKTCGPLVDAIRDACPNGVDIYFDNVGGEILDATLLTINDFARILFCGAIASYNAEAPVPGPYNMWQILAHSARLEGFLIRSYLHRFPEAIAEMSSWMDSGKIKFREQIVDGLENTLDAFLMLFDGRNSGKLMLRVAPE